MGCPKTPNICPNPKITDDKIAAFKATVEFLISSNQFDISSDDCVIKSADDITKYINTSYYDAIK